MDRERWRAVSPLLDRALDLSPEERAAWVESLRASQPELAADLESLLEEAGAVAAEDFLGGRGPAHLLATSLEGQSFGAYRLVSTIGYGGMGSVWQARRSDGRFEGDAAIKLLNAELIGRGGEERFLREGNILARLTHPNIARLLDAGLATGGQPYLVLEFVDGDHIDRYCDEHRLSVEERLRLFLEATDAVEHAHANLVVHRDLKPSNVLVSRSGQVKLLDFGIAKLLEGEGLAGAPTALTREGDRAFTPQYAAPEQVTGGSITTATDVYSLGVLLYVLLGGGHPSGETSELSPAELIEAIVHTDPPRLSDRVADLRTHTAAELHASAERRLSTPERLRRLFSGDLDTIVAKALKKRPEDRYLSVGAFADDIRRFLAHEPIAARPDSVAYRGAKFVRRHRVPVALGALVVVALAAGLAGTLTQAHRATREAVAAAEQRDFALRQLSRAEAINDLNSFLLSDAAPGGKPFTVGDLLARAERIVERQRGGATDDRVDVLVSLGREYQNLDEDAKAGRLLEQAYELSRTGTEAVTRARAACALASASANDGNHARAEELLQEGLGLLPERPEFALTRVFCLLRGSEVARNGDAPQEAIDRVRAAQHLLVSTGQGSELLELRVAMDLAESLRTAGRSAEASAAFADAEARLVALGRDETETAGTLLNNWGLVQRSLGQPLEAERLLRRAIAISTVRGDDESVSPMLLGNYAWVLHDLDRLDEAKDYGERAYDGARRAGNEPATTFALFVRLAVERRRGDAAAMAAILAELEPRARRMYPPHHLGFAVIESEKGLLAGMRGDVEAALAAQRRAMALVEANQADSAFVSSALQRCAELELERGRAQAAVADAERAVHLERQAAEPSSRSSWIGLAELMRGRALLAQGQTATARGAFAAALEQLEPTLGPEHPATRQARDALRSLD